MNDIRNAVRELLLGDAAVYSVIDGDTPRASGGNRIFSGNLPQREKNPSIVQNLVSEQTDYHMQGPSGLAQVRIQIDAWALSQDAAVDLANKVKDAISGFQGTQAYGSPPTSVVIQGIFADQARDDYDSEAKLFRRGRDYIVWYEEN